MSGVDYGTVYENESKRIPLTSAPDIFIDNVPLPISDSLKFLGAIFDSQLTFESHVLSVLSVTAQ